MKSRSEKGPHDHSSSLSFLVRLYLYILRDKLFEIAVKLVNINRKYLFITQDLFDEFFLILFANEPSLDAQPFVCYFFAAIVGDLLVPLAVVSLQPVLFNPVVSLL